MSARGLRLAERPLAVRLVHGASWALMNRVLALPAALLTTMLLARLLSPADLGAYFLAFSLANLLAIVAQLGLGGPIIKLVSAALAERRPEAARRAVVIGFQVTVLCGTLLAIAMAGAPGRALAGLLEDGERLLNVLPLVGLLVPAFALIDLCAESLRGFHDLRANSMLGNLLAHRLLMMAALLVLWLAGWPGTLSDVLLISVGAGGLVSMIGAILVARHLRALERCGEQPPAREVLRHAPHFLVIRINAWLTLNAGLWLLGIFRPPEEVALYGAASRMAALVAVPMLIGNAVLAPVIAELHAKREHARLERVVRNAGTAAVVVPLALVLVFGFEGDGILTLVYTSTYGEAYAVLIVLAVARLVHAGMGACGLCLTMTGHQHDVMRLGIANSAATLIAYVLVVPALGALGAALVTATSLIVYNLALALVSSLRLKIKTWATSRPAAPRDLMALLSASRTRGRRP